VIDRRAPSRTTSLIVGGAVCDLYRDRGTVGHGGLAAAIQNSPNE
jgi:hypothetical protein